MKLTTLARSLGRWLDGSGPSADIVLSTRVRLARNMKDVPFTHRAREEPVPDHQYAIPSPVAADAATTAISTWPLGRPSSWSMRMSSMLTPDSPV